VTTDQFLYLGPIADVTLDTRHGGVEVKRLGRAPRLSREREPDDLGTGLCEPK
jgi:hypothetical protein